MNVEEMSDQLLALKKDAEAQFPSADSRGSLEDLRVEFIGKKGRLTGLLRSMGKLAATDRPAMGKVANEVRDCINALLEGNLTRLQNEEREKAISQHLDVSLPGRRHERGREHPLSQTSSDILDVLAKGQIL